MANVTESNLAQGIFSSCKRILDMGAFRPRLPRLIAIWLGATLLKIGNFVVRPKTLRNNV